MTTTAASGVVAAVAPDGAVGVVVNGCCHGDGASKSGGGGPANARAVASASHVATLSGVRMGKKGWEVLGVVFLEEEEEEDVNGDKKSDTEDIIEEEEEENDGDDNVDDERSDGSDAGKRDGGMKRAAAIRMGVLSR